MEGQLAGYVIGATIQHAHEDGWILRLKVAYPHRRKTLGTGLLTTLFKAFRKVGVTRVSLTVAPNNYAAISFYRVRGFEETGVVSDYFGSGEDRILMSLTLPLRDAQ